MKIAKLGVIAIVIVISSAGMGMSYASVNNSIPFKTTSTQNGYNFIGIRAHYHGDNLESGLDTVYIDGVKSLSDKNVSVTNFYNNGDVGFNLDINGEWYPFWYWDNPPSLELINAYPCYASSITFWFGNLMNPEANIKAVTLDEVDGLVIDYWEVDNGQHGWYNGILKDELINVLVNDIVLNGGEYLSIQIDFHFDNSLDRNIAGELFTYSFTWQGDIP
jgi:hypothetical protein